MSQVPSRDILTSVDYDPKTFEGKVQSYWNSRCDLLQRIPNLETRGVVAALIDGRVIERLIKDVPASTRTGVSMEFSDFDETLLVFYLIHSYSPQWADKFLREAVPYVGVIYARYIVTPDIRALLENWNDRDRIVTSVLAAAGPWLATQGLAIVGFTTGGVAAGSLAALWQSTIGNVVAGSLFSTFQSFGALGAVTGPLGIAVGVVGTGIYGAYKLAVQPTKQERFNTMLFTLLSDDVERARFWACIGV